MPARWCIWYHDGTTFDWRDGEPADAPGSGVVIIAQTHPDATPTTMSAQHIEGATLEGYDWYIHDRGAWFATNMMGLVQYVSEPGPKVIKMGRWVPRHVYAELHSKAAAWS